MSRTLDRTDETIAAYLGTKLAERVATNRPRQGTHRTIHTNTIRLWFDKDAEAAARFYAATFPNSELPGCTRLARNGERLPAILH